jgi:hypothetical protein
MTTINQQKEDNSKKPGNNSDREDNDKAPGEEKGTFEEVTPNDLKGKNVDADPSTEEGKPVAQ